MSEKLDESWLFIVEWYDPLPQLKKQYLLKYYYDSHMVEMIDVRNKKLFLKKSPLPKDITSTEFFVGGRVLVYSRELDIIDYGDLKTKEKFNLIQLNKYILISLKQYNNWGKIIILLENYYNNIKLKTIILLSNQLNQLSYFNNIHYFDSENILLAIDVSINNNDEIQSILKDYSNDIIISNNTNDYNIIQNIIQSNETTALYDSSTCVVIKPHIVKSKQVGNIIDFIIQQGYEISCIKSIYFDKIQAEEFLEVYRGVIPSYSDHVVQLSNGLSIALEVRCENAVNTFRITAGPWDIGMAKELYPTNTIRGLYGVDNVKNAIHCTDLPQDALLECQYCFSLMN